MGAVPIEYPAGGAGKGNGKIGTAVTTGNADGKDESRRLEARDDFEAMDAAKDLADQLTGSEEDRTCVHARVRSTEEGPYIGLARQRTKREQV